jgi:hypothetical protein
MKYEPVVFQELLIKADSIGDSDFFYKELTDCTDTDIDDYEIHKDSIDNGISFDLHFNTMGRDGCFERKQLFAVYEQKDLEGLIATLSDSLDLYDPKENVNDNKPLFTEGVCGNGAVILKDGVAISISDLLQELNS